MNFSGRTFKRAKLITLWETHSEVTVSKKIQTVQKYSRKTQKLLRLQPGPTSTISNTDSTQNSGASSAPSLSNTTNHHYKKKITVIDLLVNLSQQFTGSLQHLSFYVLKMNL